MAERSTTISIAVFATRSWRSWAAVGHVRQAAVILDDLVLAEEFPEFLTLLAYSHLD